MTDTVTESATSVPSAALQAVRVWDLPTRMFHILLALGIVAMAVTGWAELLEWHFRVGYGVLALLIFRLLWGVVGGRWSRFGSFIYSPRTILAYLRGRGSPEHEVGHSPTGALSVFALLFFSALQVLAGLCSDDEVASSGPLVAHIPGVWVSRATHYHTEIGPWILCALIALHVAAVGYYRRWRGRDLVTPMVLGDKQLPHGTPESRDTAVTRTLAALVFAGCVALVLYFLRWAAGTGS